MTAIGRVRAVRNGLVETELPALALGRGVRIETPKAHRYGSVVGLDPHGAKIAVHAALDGIARGMRVVEDDAAARISLGTAALGRAIDAFGSAIDGGPAVRGIRARVELPVPRSSQRRAIEHPLWTGVKAIDSLLTIGRGARVGIFGGPGLGKSTLLETIVEGARADAVVLALVGERGREAQWWIERRNNRTSIVVATSDASAGERVRAARVAFAQARTLAKRGLDVLLVMDSLARFAAAQREIALGTGESVGRGGFPPSVFAEMANLIECAGTFDAGSVSLVASVLSDGDERDPVSEAARSLLDGHVQLSSRLANAGRFPAIDVCASASRTMPGVVSPRHARDARMVREAIALLERTSDGRELGIEPSDMAARRAIAAEQTIECLVRQDRAPERASSTLAALAETADTLGEPYEYRL